jgi:hypothetical protein
MLKPAVPKNILLLLAGVVWFCGGTMLLVLAYSWLSQVDKPLSFIYFGVGLIAALLIHRFGFRKIAAKNINRILAKSGWQCLFSCFAWKSYLLIAVMVTMGKLFRRSDFPKPYLAILYTTIGLALVLSSIKYLRVFIAEMKDTAKESSSKE